MIKIDSTTPIKNFPEIYNDNNNELIAIISSLQDKISKLESENVKLRKVIGDKLLELKSQYEKSLDLKIEEFDTKIEQIEKIKK